MKSIELLPTDKNILNTLVEDPFNRNEEISSFLELLTTIEGHFVRPVGIRENLFC